MAGGDGGNPPRNDYASIWPSFGWKAGRGGRENGDSGRSAAALGTMYGAGIGRLFSGFLCGNVSTFDPKGDTAYTDSLCTFFSRCSRAAVDRGNIWGIDMWISEGKKKREGLRPEKREGHERSNGYMTLEASLLMPMTAMLCGFLMLLSFYLYTVTFLNQAAYIAALRGSLARAGRDRGTVASEEMERILEESVLPVRNLKKEVTATGLEVKVTLEVEISLPFPEIFPLENRVWQIRAEKRVRIRSAVAFIRGMRMLSSS